MSLSTFVKGKVDFKHVEIWLWVYSWNWVWLSKEKLTLNISKYDFEYVCQFEYDFEYICQKKSWP
jgi:hypothetical protein